VNKMYYVEDDPKKPKSYDRGREVVVGGAPWGDLLMVSGIIGIRWKSRVHRFKPSIEASNISFSDYPFPARIDFWVRNAVTIKGRPEWLFIKLHSHGAYEDDWNAVLRQQADAMYSYLEEQYNDGKKYALHYVSAREMYNLIKAAEAGKSGNPNEYRDFVIPRYTYLPKD